MIDFLVSLGIAVGFGLGATFVLLALLLFYETFLTERMKFNSPLIIIIFSSLLLFIGSSILFFVFA